MSALVSGPQPNLVGEKGPELFISLELWTRLVNGEPLTDEEQAALRALRDASGRA